MQKNHTAYVFIVCALLSSDTRCHDSIECGCTVASEMPGSRANLKKPARANSASAIVAHEEKQLVHQAGPHEDTSGKLGILFCEALAHQWCSSLILVQELKESILDAHKGLALVFDLCLNAPDELWPRASLRLVGRRRCPEHNKRYEVETFAEGQGNDSP